jgi:hypothetical protein
VIFTVAGITFRSAAVKLRVAGVLLPGSGRWRRAERPVIRKNTTSLLLEHLQYRGAKPFILTFLLL